MTNTKKAVTGNGKASSRQFIESEQSKQLLDQPKTKLSKLEKKRIREELRFQKKIKKGTTQPLLFATPSTSQPSAANDVFLQAKHTA